MNWHTPGSIRATVVLLAVIFSNGQVFCAQPADDVPSPGPLSQEEILTLPPTEAYAHAIQMLASGKQAESESVIGQLAFKYPDDQRISFAHAVVTRSRFDVEGSAPLFEHVRQIDPDSTLGQCAGFMLAIDSRENLVKAFPALLDAAGTHRDPLILWLGGIASRTLNLDAAGAECYRLLLTQWNPGPVLVHQTYANLLEDLHKYDQALAHRVLAVEMEPKGWSVEGLALTLWKLKRYDEASKAFARSLQLSPKAGSYYVAWADMLLEQDLLEEAVSKCQSALAIDATDLHALHTWGRILYKRNDYDGAVAKFSECLKIEPKYYFASNYLADICEFRGQIQQAINHRQAAVTAAPISDNYSGLARLYVRLGRLSLAESTYSQAAAADPHNANILADWAEALLDAKRPAEALEKSRKAYSLNPKSAYVMYVFATSLQATAKTPVETRVAIQLFRASIKANPDNWRAYIHLADMLSNPKDDAESSALRREGRGTPR